MPRLFYKTVVAVLFVLIFIAVIIAEVTFVVWLVDLYPSLLAWIGFILLGLIDAAIFVAIYECAIKRVKAA